MAQADDEAILGTLREQTRTLQGQRDRARNWAVGLGIALAIILLRILFQPPIFIPHYTTTECVDAKQHIRDAIECVHPDNPYNVHLKWVNHPRHYVSVLQYLLGNR